MRNSFRSILSGVPKSTAPGNVVQLPGPEWSDIEHEIIEATNEIVHWTAEAARVETGYNTACDRLAAARARFSDRAKTVGARVDFPTTPPPLEREE